MGETTWSDRMSAVRRWVRRMLNGVPRGGAIRMVDLSEVSTGGERPTISIVFGQWPGRRLGDAVCAGVLGPEWIRRVVAAGNASGLSAPEWRVHGLEDLPRGSEWRARWLVGLAEASGGGDIAVDTAEMTDRIEGRLVAHLRRLAPQAGIEIRQATTDRGGDAEENARS